MKITILDGYTINPGDLSWKPIESFGSCTVYDRTAPEETYERSKDAEIVITSKVVFDRDLILRLPELRYIGVIATGYNVIDLAAAKEGSVVVTNIPDYCSSSVAQMVFAHILEFARHVGHHDRTVKEGKWTSSRDFCYWDYPQMELVGKTLGLLGCGRIGRETAQIALGFGMKVIAYDLHPISLDDLVIEFVDLDTIFSESDIISLHCPLTPDTKGIIRTENLSKMKPSVLLINTARGPLVNEEDLALALNTGVIAGAGLDVMNVEPPPPESPLVGARNCHITPHIAWAGLESRVRLIQMTAANIRAFLDGNPVNVVN